jgi:tRNA U34 5-carboxymethylaminomethyl modifying GTPase MnmE/TrmE
MVATDTIVAIATAAGPAGVGIVRLSGPMSLAIAEGICAARLQPRNARYARFRDATDDTIDDGIALYFAAPASYTGEDVVELQAHGSPAVLQELVTRCVALGARRARPPASRRGRRPAGGTSTTAAAGRARRWSPSTAPGRRGRRSSSRRSRAA